MKHQVLHQSRAAWRGRLLILTAILGVGALTSPVSGDPSLSTSSINIYGSTGLISIPIGDVLPYGFYTIGVNRIEHKYRPYPDEPGDTVAHFATAGVLPHIEVTASATNHDGKLGVQYRETLAGGYGGWNFDRMLSIQVLAIRQDAGWPFSLAAGAQDAFGTSVFNARYLVASYRRPGFGVHAGWGTHKLPGFFGGIDLQAIRGVRVMLEHNGTHANVGLSLQVKRLRISPALMGLRSLGGGIAYSHHL